MRRLVLMPDYYAPCLWDDISGVGVPPSDLPISEPLQQRIVAWGKRWEKINDAAIEADDFDSPDPDHEQETHELWMALRKELGPEFEVGLPVAPPPGPETRLHVVWKLGGTPELPTWHQRREWVPEEDDR